MFFCILQFKHAAANLMANCYFFLEKAYSSKSYFNTSCTLSIHATTNFMPNRFFLKKTDHLNVILLNKNSIFSCEEYISKHKKLNKGTNSDHTPQGAILKSVLLANNS